MAGFPFNTPAHRAALDTDRAWSAELVKAFGRNAGDMRYVKAGQGDPGTPLRAAYEARHTASTAWDIVEA